MTENRLSNYKITNGYILTEPLDELGGASAGEISLRQTEDRPQFARAIMVGGPMFSDYTDRKIESPCKVGDIIIHSSMGMEKFIIEGKEYRLVPFKIVFLVKEK